MQKKRTDLRQWFSNRLWLTDDDCVIDQSENLAKWAKLVKDYALDQALNNGVKYPGFKVVEGRSNRKYAEDDSKIADVLIKAGYDEKNIYKKEILNITQMGALLGRARFNELLGEYVIQTAGKPTQHVRRTNVPNGIRRESGRKILKI